MLGVKDTLLTLMMGLGANSKLFRGNLTLSVFRKPLATDLKRRKPKLSLASAMTIIH
jgi:hypothetical protein